MIPSIEIECSNEECRQKMVVIPPTMGAREPAVVGLPDVGEGQRLVEAEITERDSEHPDDPDVAVVMCPTCQTPNEVPGLLEA